jgi:hypothetical protein
VVWESHQTTEGTGEVSLPGGDALVAEEKPGETFFVLDFDRTLADTDKLHRVLEEAIEAVMGISAMVVRQAEADALAAGQTFDAARYVRRLDTTKGPLAWAEVQRVFVAQAQRQDVLLPSAGRLLALLDAATIPYGIVTFGRETWQLAKLEGARLLEVPHVVTHIEEKGRLIAGWKHGAEFIIPPMLTRDFVARVARRIVFLDDKPVSFYGLPEKARGILVRPGDGRPLLPFQEGPVPSGVVSVNGIGEAINLLFM